MDMAESPESGSLHIDAEYKSDVAKKWTNSNKWRIEFQSFTIESMWKTLLTYDTMLEHRPVSRTVLNFNGNVGLAQLRKLND